MIHRGILALGEFNEATSINTIKILKKAELVAASLNGTIYAINTDRGPQFYANTWGKKGKGKSQFEKYLERKRIKHIPSRKGNPQTNGKLERWFLRIHKTQEKIFNIRRI